MVRANPRNIKSCRAKNELDQGFDSVDRRRGITAATVEMKVTVPHRTTAFFDRHMVRSAVWIMFQTIKIAPIEGFTEKS